MKSFDLFLKANTALKKSTVTGGVVTVITATLLIILILGETIQFFSTSTEEFIEVDRSFGQQLSINVDLVFPNSHCRFVFFDVVDSTGEEQIAVDDIKKIPISNPSAKLKEGCHVKGEMHINKIAGNFHFALGKGVPDTALGSSMSTDPFAKTMVGAQHQHRFDMFELQMFNASHEIRRLSFGKEYPSMPKQPLDGFKRSVASGMGQYNYYISVVPTTYVKLNGKKIKSCQYSYTEKIVEVEANAQRFPHPGVFFYLSISPLAIHINEEDKSFLHFFTDLCAIVGSIWVISSFVESALSYFIKSDHVISTSSSSSSSASSSMSSSSSSSSFSTSPTIATPTATFTAPSPAFSQPASAVSRTNDDAQGHLD